MRQDVEEPAERVGVHDHAAHADHGGVQALFLGDALDVGGQAQALVVDQGVDDGDEEAGLVAEVVADGGLVDAGLGGDVLQRDRLVAALGEQAAWPPSRIFCAVAGRLVSGSSNGNCSRPLAVFAVVTIVPLAAVCESAGSCRATRASTRVA